MPSPQQFPAPDATCDGGDLDCGSGLLLIIRSAMQPLASGGVLEVRSREGSVREDLPAWCRMVGHALVAQREGEAWGTSYYLRKHGEDATLAQDLSKAREFAWTARVRWQGGMETRVSVRNHAFTVGQPASFDTADSAPSAVELLLGALGSALATGLAWRMDRAGHPVRRLEVVTRAKSEGILSFLGLEPAANPGLSGVDVQLYLDTDAAPEEIEPVVQETIARCPLTQSLVRSVPVNTQWKSV